MGATRMTGEDRETDGAPAPAAWPLPHEAASTAMFAVALPVAAYAEAVYLGASPAGLSALLLMGAATLLSGAYVYGRLSSMTREMREAAQAVRRLPRMCGGVHATARGIWISRSGPGGALSAAILTTAFEIEQRIDALEARTCRDVETGLMTREGLRLEIAVEINRARRTDTPVILGLIDIDRFDGIARERGAEDAGSLANTAARIIGERLRNYDRIARRDASSFLMLMPGVGPDSAMEVLSRVRDEIEDALELPNGVSAGYALLDRSDLGPDPILDRADLRLSQLRLSGGARSVEAA